jgi:hypothetical protein
MAGHNVQINEVEKTMDNGARHRKQLASLVSDYLKHTPRA